MARSILGTCQVVLINDTAGDEV